MKKSITIFSFYLSIIFVNGNTGFDSKGCNPQNNLSKGNDSLLIKKLLSVDKLKYISEPVDSFLKNIEISEFRSYTFFEEPIGVLNRLSLWYSPKIQIYIYVSDYKYIDPSRRKKKWDFNLFKKEKIAEINIVYNEQIVERTGNVSD